MDGWTKAGLIVDVTNKYPRDFLMAAVQLAVSSVFLCFLLFSLQIGARHYRNKPADLYLYFAHSSAEPPYKA